VSPPGPAPKKKSAVVAAGALKDFDDMVAILKILKTFAALSSDDKALFQKIVTNARRSTIRQYYLDKLDLPMSTEMEDPALTQASNAGPAGVGRCASQGECAAGCAASRRPCRHEQARGHGPKPGERREKFHPPG
jgi:hypothetical protein